MAIREIREEGDPLLRKKSREIEKIDDRVLELLDDMYETLKKSKDGIGIAAPQVGVLKRVIIIDLSDEGGEGPYKLINPKIIAPATDAASVPKKVFFKPKQSPHADINLTSPKPKPSRLNKSL